VSVEEKRQRRTRRTQILSRSHCNVLKENTLHPILIIITIISRDEVRETRERSEERSQEKKEKEKRKVKNNK